MDAHMLTGVRAIYVWVGGHAQQISKGAASTLNSGTVKTITRGVNIENANFEGKDLSVRLVSCFCVIKCLRRAPHRRVDGTALVMTTSSVIIHRLDCSDR